MVPNASSVRKRKHSSRHAQLVADIYYRFRRWSEFFERRQFDDLRREFYDGLWRRAASNVQADFNETKYGFQRIRRGELTTFVSRSKVMLDDHMTLSLMANKALTYELLSAKGHQVPKHCIFTMSQLSQAEAFLDRHGGEVVVKPANGTGGGRGVTTGITTKAELRKASGFAASYDPLLLAEEQLTGASYRLLYLDGRFIDALRRDPPQVIGDGEHSLTQLVKLENKRRLETRPLTALSPLIIDRDCRNALARQGLTTSSRPAAGQAIDVKTAINENAAAQNHNVREVVHRDIVEKGAKLVRDLGVRFAGLDLICPDITIPPSDSGSFISEINATPGIHHHYLLAEPEKGVPVADLVLDHLFSQHQGVMRI